MLSLRPLIVKNKSSLCLQYFKMVNTKYN